MQRLPTELKAAVSRSKLNTGIMNKTQKILTVAALVVFIAFGAFHYLKVKDFYHLTPTLGVPILGTSGPAHAIMLTERESADLRKTVGSNCARRI